MTPPEHAWMVRNEPPLDLTFHQVAIHSSTVHETQ